MVEPLVSHSGCDSPVADATIDCQQDLHPF